jgi:hypothetical protein
MATIYDPARFQGTKKTRNYFEGWYYKCVTADESRTLAIIPGVSYGSHESDEHCFVQVFDGLSSDFEYRRFPIEAFEFNRRRFDVRIEGNSFGSEGLVLDMPDIGCSGELTFHERFPWPVRLLSPGAMGWYAFAPFMEDYHGILSFDHEIRGSLEFKGSMYDFTGGRGYIEKDWGYSFPESWIWIQTNHFDTPRTSLSLSIAKIPWLGSAFTGFIIGFLHRGELIRLCTYTGARIGKLDVENNQTALITVSGSGYTLEIRARKKDTVRLKAPVSGSMAGHVNESLNSEVDVALYRENKKAKDLIFGERGRMAGVEIHGEMTLLTDIL